ncbi:MAG: hypothetical protein QXW04_00865 [Candidatus Aenigmatarchaeota archaeon]
MDTREIENKIKEGYILAEMWFETVALEKKIAEDALKEHIKKLKEFDEIIVIDEEYLEAKEIKDFEKSYSSVAKTKILAKNIYALIFATIVYAPSSVIIIKPEKFSFDLITVQTIINTFADLIHRISKIGGKIIIPLPYQKDLSKQDQQ